MQISLGVFKVLKGLQLLEFFNPSLELALIHKNAQNHYAVKSHL